MWLYCKHEGRVEMGLIFTQLSPSFKLSNCRHFHSEKLFKTTLSPSNEILLPDRFLTIMGEGIWNCGVMKSVVTLLIKVVHISTNSSQSPPIWEEIMTWLSPSLNTTSESASESQSQSFCLVCNMCWLRDQKIFERLHNDIWEFHQNRNNTQMKNVQRFPNNTNSLISTRKYLTITCWEKGNWLIHFNAPPDSPALSITSGCWHTVHHFAAGISLHPR